jgi:hypothetical protein
MARSGARRGGTQTDAQVRELLADEALACYFEWREGAAVAAAAYRRWAAAPTHERAACHRAYVAAVDQEESAADLYGLLITELRTKKTWG